MKQLDIEYDICAKNHGGNVESIEAHECTKSNKHRHMGMILDCLAQRGPFGATAYELVSDLGLRMATASARCSDLKKAGKVVPNGERRKTDSGSFAAVLVIPEYKPKDGAEG